MSTKHPQRPPHLSSDFRTSASRISSDLRLLLGHYCDRCHRHITNTERYRVQASLAYMPGLARLYAEARSCFCWECHCRGQYRLCIAVACPQEAQDCPEPQDFYEAEAA